MVTRRKIPVSLWYDAMTPAFAVGVVLERFGAFLAGSGHGKYAASFPLAVRFPMDSPVYEAHRRTLGALLPPAATDSLPVHPTQLYAVVVGLIGVALCVVLYKRRRFSGQVFMGYLAYWLVARSFVEEFFRADAATPVVGPFHGGQFGAAAVIVGLIVVYRVRSRRAAAQPGALRLWEGGAWSPPGQGPADADKRSGRHGERTSRSGKRR
jgi:phosphatidylglycerol:prolipoprotein diacylglycerol transferase